MRNFMLFLTDNLLEFTQVDNVFDDAKQPRSVWKFEIIREIINAVELNLFLSKKNS